MQTPESFTAPQTHHHTHGKYAQNLSINVQKSNAPALPSEAVRQACLCLKGKAPVWRRVAHHHQGTKNIAGFRPTPTSRRPAWSVGHGTRPVLLPSKSTAGLRRRLKAATSECPFAGRATRSTCLDTTSKRVSGISTPPQKKKKKSPGIQYLYVIRERGASERCRQGSTHHRQTRTNPRTGPRKITCIYATALHRLRWRSSVTPGTSTMGAGRRGRSRQDCRAHTSRGPGSCFPEAR